MAAAAHAVAVGSPVHYGNPSAAILAALEAGFGPGWGDGTFEGVPAAVFATGGGIHQGTEAVLAGLAGGLLNFGFRLVTPRVSADGYHASLGAAAVTGTPPWGAGAGAGVDAAFLRVAGELGARLAAEAGREWAARCGSARGSVCTGRSTPS